MTSQSFRGMGLKLRKKLMSHISKKGARQGWEEGSKNPETGDLIYGWPLVFKSPHYVHINAHVLKCNINVWIVFYFIDREKNTKLWEVL
jgi:hypothetical protein